MESDKIQALRLIYASKLSEKAAQLKIFIDQLSDSLGSVEHRKLIDHEIAEYLHRLVGSAGMYGYDDIAERAKKTMYLSEKPGNDGLASALIELHDLLRQYG